MFITLYLTHTYTYTHSIAGWHTANRSSLSSRFHIGDCIRQIDGISVTSMQHAKIVLQRVNTLETRIALVRLPHAKVLLVPKTVSDIIGFDRKKGKLAEVYYFFL